MKDLYPSELTDVISSIRIIGKEDGLSNKIPFSENTEIYIYLSGMTEQDNLFVEPYIMLYFNYEKDHWTLPFSPVAFSKKIKEICSGKIIEFYTPSIFYASEEQIGIPLGKLDKNNIKTHISILASTFNKIIDEAIGYLIQETEKESLVTFFVFPPEIKTSCEQYLIYFSEFLIDLGIEVTSTLEECHSGDTLFKVTPKNKEDALSKIKDALEIYLSLLTQSNLSVLASDFNDSSVQQLVSNIYHLKGQLALAQSIIQNKDATINSLQLTNYQYMQVLEKNKNESEKGEEIFGGLAKVKEYEGKGFTINLAELFRRMKRRFK